MSRSPYRKVKRAFTLIEMSIVLVIIGLIVGGILVGRDLVNSATVRAQIKQMQELQTQIATFSGKYGCIPGDCPNATTFFGTTDAAGRVVRNGDGDGLVRSTVGAPSGGYSAPYIPGECLMGGIQDSELPQAFMQLNDGGMGNYISDGTGNTMNHGYGPLQAISNGTGLLLTCINSTVYPSSAFDPAHNNSNIIVLGAYQNNWNSTNRVTYIIGESSYGSQLPIGIPVIYAKMIDSKIDDGLPASGPFGVMGALGNKGSNPGTPACLTNSNTTYPDASANCTATVGFKLGQ